MTSTRDDWLRLGALTAPWGVHGEIKIRLDADVEVMRRVKRAYLGDERRAVDVVGVYQRGRLHSVKLRGIDSIEAAETLRDAVLWLPRSEAPALPPGHLYVDDVLGLRAVTTDGHELGEVVDVMTNAANDVYVVRGPAGEVLIPAIRDVVVELDPAAGLLRVEPMPGLLEE